MSVQSNQLGQPAMSRVLMQALVESERANESRAALANRMGVEVAVLDSMVQAFESANGTGAWAQMVVEQRIRADVTAANWDELELETTQRLARSVKDGKVTRVSDLLAIARTANTAARRGAHERVDSSFSDGSNGYLRAGVMLPGGEAVMELRLGRQVANAIRDVTVTERAEGARPAFESFAFSRIQTPAELRAISDAELVNGSTDSDGPDGPEGPEGPDGSRLPSATQVIDNHNNIGDSGGSGGDSGDSNG